MDKIPYAVKKSCEILKLSLDGLTKSTVIEAWKQEIVLHVFPMETDYAVSLNIAKDRLLRWLEELDGEAGMLAKLSPRDGGGADALSSPTEEPPDEDHEKSS